MYNPYEKHLTEKVMSASPMELTMMLYAAAREAINGARLALQANDAMTRSRHISRAMNIIAELNNSLNVEQGGEPAARLRDLYVYVVGQLQEAHIQQTEQPLVDAQNVLSTLEQAWKACLPAETPDHTAAGYGSHNQETRSASFSYSL